MTKINKRTLAALLLVAGIVSGGAGVAIAQAKYRKLATRGPFRVFLTKPVITLGITAGELYREQELVGAALNDLDRKGFVPLWTEVMTESDGRQPDVQRLLIVCRKR